MCSELLGEIESFRNYKGFSIIFLNRYFTENSRWVPLSVDCEPPVVNLQLSCQKYKNFFGQVTCRLSRSLSVCWTLIIQNVLTNEFDFETAYLYYMRIRSW